ncbi:MAG: hypothetical protein WDZ93_00780 [Candidatus Paceibacterota bacterium]
MKDIGKTDLIKDHTVDIYDSSPAIAEAARNLEPRSVTLFTRAAENARLSEDVTVRKHMAASAAALTAADVCMLDGDALKVLAVRYPSDAHYVLARLALRRGWFLGFPGLLRRLILGRVKLGGIVRLCDADRRNSYWLVIHRTKKTTKQERLLLPKSIGIAAFLTWLRSERIQYVVPRFYEQLPELHRDGGDLDLLVADSDVEKVETYLRSHAEQCVGTNADSVPIGMHSVSLSVGVPYYPPPLARQMLERAVDGPAGSRVPEPTDALNALIYHALYHGKGYATNIPSTQDGKPENPPENDYGAVIKRKADELGIEVGETMEDLDEYMDTVGWRPKRDTLAKIAEKNAWVRDRFFSDTCHGGTGLTVFMLKERALERGLKEEIVEHLRAGGLTIVRASVLTDEQKRRAADDVRGGNWAGPEGSAEGLLPAAIVIAVDPECANLPPAYAGEYERVWSKRRKQRLRDLFDSAGEASLVHAADNTAEAWEYIETCFPDEIDTIKGEIEREAHVPLLVRIRRFVSPTYIAHTIKFTTRDFAARRL